MDNKSKIEQINLTDTIISICSNQSKTTYSFLFILLIFFIIFFSTLKIYCGLSPIFAPWDIFNLLNGAWRIFNGQSPHLDYYNPIGSLTYIPIAISMKAWTLSSSSIVYGNLILGVSFSIWSWFIARNRLSAANVLIFSFFILIITISTRPLGYGIKNTTYAMIYNRYGYALFSILLIELFIRPKKVTNKTDCFGGLSVGIILALLFFCKVTYFLVGFTALLIYFILYKLSRIWVAMACIGIILVFGSLLAFFQINPIAYFQDIIYAGRAQSISMRLWRLIGSCKSNFLHIYLTYVLLCFSSMVTWNIHDRKIELKKNIILWAIVTFIIVSGILLSSGNAPEGKDLPTFFISGLIILNYLFHHIKANANNSKFKVKIVALFAVSVVIPIFFGRIISKDVSSIAYSTVWNMVKLPSIHSTQRFQSTTLFDFIIPNNSNWKTAYWRAKDVPEKINDGLNLLRDYAKRNSRIFCLCYTDPFSFGLELPPAKGTPLWWDLDFSFNEHVFPEAQNILREVNIIMAPKLSVHDDGCCKETVRIMEKIYGEYIEKNFFEKAQSKNWILYEKRGSSG